MIKHCNWCMKQAAECECKKGTMSEKKPYIPVVIESPYAGDIERNLRYLRACMRDCLLKGEAPYASHALYTQPGVLRDEVPEERQHGIEAGFAFRPLMKKTVVYTDLGYSTGMKYGIKHAEEIDHPIEYRQLGPDWDKHVPSRADVMGENIDAGLRETTQPADPPFRKPSCGHSHFDARDGFCFDCGGQS